MLIDVLDGAYYLLGPTFDDAVIDEAEFSEGFGLWVSQDFICVSTVTTDAQVLVDCALVMGPVQEQRDGWDHVSSSRVHLTGPLRFATMEFDEPQKLTSVHEIPTWTGDHLIQFFGRSAAMTERLGKFDPDIGPLEFHVLTLSRLVR